LRVRRLPWSARRPTSYEPLSSAHAPSEAHVMPSSSKCA
jgi:hypothetical protein